MTVYFSEGAELLPWTDERWLADAHTWIDDRLSELGLTRTGDIVQVYVRSWSTVMRVPTDDGVLFFKASGASQAMEVALVNRLATWRDDVAAPLASDEERAWMLMRDAGTRLRELPENTDVEMWTTIVAEYADLQRTVAPHVDELLTIGVHDFRLERLPELYEELVDSELIVHETTPSEHEKFVAWRTELAELCAELASYRIPETIEHNDLHTGNVFFNAGRAFFFDWGDSSVSHPFHTMWTTLRVFASTLDVAVDDPLVMQVRDAYLGVFGDAGACLRPFELAQRTAIVTKALTFVPALLAMSPPFQERYHSTAAGVLRRLFDA